MTLNLITKYQPSLSSSRSLTNYKLSLNENLLRTSKLIRRQLQINHVKLKRYFNNISNKLITNIDNIYNLNKKQIVLG